MGGKCKSLGLEICNNGFMRLITGSKTEKISMLSYNDAELNQHIDYSTTCYNTLLNVLLLSSTCTSTSPLLLSDSDKLSKSVKTTW